MRLRRFLAVAFLIHLPVVAATDTRLSYAGITIETTIEDIKLAYPHSDVRDTWIDVAEADSRDFIRHISVGSDSVALGFGRRLASGRDEFPLCLKVFDRINAVHGGPDIVQNLQEDAVKVHRRVWKRGNEYLGLRCFERDGERYAERVELYHFGDSAI